MGKLTAKIVPGDWNGVAHAIAKLDEALNTGAAPTFADLTIVNTLTVDSIAVTNDIVVGGGVTIGDLTASRLLFGDGGKVVDSVEDLTAWIAGAAGVITVTDDSDGTVTIDVAANGIDDTHIDWGSGANQVNAGDVPIALGVGSPTIDTIQEYFDNVGSSGYFTGGLISDAGSGTIDITAGEGFIRTTADDNVPLVSFKWSASLGLAIPINTTQYVFVSDTGVISLNTDEFHESVDNIMLGVVTDEGGAISHAFNLGVRLEESIGQMGRYIRHVDSVVRNRRKGGLLFGESADVNRFVTLTTGQLEWGRTSYPIPAFDTSGADTFDTYSAGGQEATGVSAWPNTQYDNAGTLTTMTNNRWAVLWWYIEPDGHVVMLYGRDQYVTEGQAEDEAEPAESIPNRLGSASVIASKFIFKKGEDATAKIETAFGTPFTGSGVTAHNNLATLAWTSSSHTGTIDTIAAFDGSGVAAELAIPLIVANGGTGAVTLTNNGVLVGSGTGAITALGQAGNGGLLIGNASGPPTVAPLTAGTGIARLNAPGSITLSTVDSEIVHNNLSGVHQGVATGDGPTFASLIVTGDITVGSMVFIDESRGELVIGAVTTFDPYPAFPGQNNITLFVRQPVSTGGGATPYAALVFTNNQTDASSGNIAQFLFANEAIAGTEKRLAQLLVQTTDQTDRGKFILRTFKDTVSTNGFVLDSDVATFAVPIDLNTNGNTFDGTINVNALMEFSFDPRVNDNISLGFGSVSDINATFVSASNAFIIEDMAGGNDCQITGFDNIKLGSGTTNVVNISPTGDMSFVGTAGFYPRRINQSSAPASGTGSTQIDVGEFLAWRDTDTGDVRLAYNDTTSGVTEFGISSGDSPTFTGLTLSGHLAAGGQATINANLGIFYNELYTITDNSVRVGVYSDTSVAKTTADMTTQAVGVLGFCKLNTANTQNWTHVLGLCGIEGDVGIITGSSGTITGAACFATAAAIADAATVTNLYGLYVTHPSVAGSNVTNTYGIYIADQDTGVTLNYAIYTLTGLVHFGDNTTIAGSMDATTYKVNGAAGANFNGAVTNITVVDGIVTAAS